MMISISGGYRGSRRSVARWTRINTPQLIRLEECSVWYVGVGKNFIKFFKGCARKKLETLKKRQEIQNLVKSLKNRKRMSGLLHQKINKSFIKYFFKVLKERLSKNFAGWRTEASIGYHWSWKSCSQKRGNENSKSKASLVARSTWSFLLICFFSSEGAKQCDC